MKKKNELCLYSSSNRYFLLPALDPTIRKYIHVPLQGEKSQQKTNLKGENFAESVRRCKEVLNLVFYGMTKINIRKNVKHKQKK
ncbi:CLUMA_CG013064, isoform A [Clunio marinus]|uniref:CLUMA_CG013064, isoform A n=1 Tax=Clunio marinus TaxID=568069 RepID=A0A1J1IHB6_9DIPT|nr:CLUMA_CG013064, isoform A [Clunio marinus]